MATVRSVLVELATFALSSYPLACGVFTLLFVKERSKNTSDQGTEYTLLLAHTAVVALCGVCMKLRYKIALMRALCAVEAALLAANFLYFSYKFGFTTWGKVRIAVRSVGVIISYVLTCGNIRRSYLATRFFIVLLSCYGIALSVQVALDPTYKFGCERLQRLVGLHRLTNLSTSLMGAAAGMLAASSLCLPFHRFHKLGVMGLLATISLIIVAMDCNLNVWTRKHRVDYYLAARLALDNVPVLSALITLLV